MVSSSGDLDIIALRDETVRLRQLINSVMKERDLAKAILSKTQALVAKKDKEIQDLLTTGHVPVSEGCLYSGLHCTCNRNSKTTIR